MSSKFGVAHVRVVAALIAFAFVLCLLGTYASAQASVQPKDEIFGGYSWLHPNGYADQGYKVLDIVDGFDFSNTYYVPAAHDLGIVVDGSGHFHGSTDPINPVNNGTTGTGVGYILGGVQYKHHTDSVSPFVRVFLGTANLSPDCCSGTRWNFAVGGGGGLDYSITPRFSIRMVQVDYIHSSYAQVSNGHGTGWNSVRLAAGLVVLLGSYYQPPVSCTASAMPTEVWAGEPVKVNTSGTNFNPKHTLTYSWAVNGGKLSSNSTQMADIDTVGMAPGSYSANATIADPKMRTMNSATCPANFTIKQPHPPEVSCSVNPAMMAANESATITMTASSPDGRPLTYTWTANGGQLSSKGSTATLTALNTDAGKTITVTGTASDDRTPPLTATCSTDVGITPVPKCVNIVPWGECEFGDDPKRPSRVDNVCKDVLDAMYLKLQKETNGKLDIVGYTDPTEPVALAAQRAVNVEYYLTKQAPSTIDPSRVQARLDGSKGKAVHFYFVPEGDLCKDQVEEGTVVDETKVKGQERKPLAHRKGKAKSKTAPKSPEKGN